MRDLGGAYLEKALPVIHDQLARAAVRLAWLLNRALGIPPEGCWCDPVVGEHATAP